MSGYMLNTTELFAYPLIRRKPDNTFIYEKGVKYASGKKEYINFCTRRDLADKRKPLFIYIHGGGFVSGLTNMRDTYVDAWAEMGFFTANIGYTYAPDKIYKEQMKEIFTALDYILDRKDEYGIDTENVVLAGESAGGYYIMYTQNLIENEALSRELGISFRHRGEIKIKALVSNCGCFNLPKLLDKKAKQSKFPGMNMMVSSLVGETAEKAREFLETAEGKRAVPKITENFPPVFVISACYDMLKYEAEDLKKELAEKNIPYGEFYCEGIIGMHAWSMALIVEPGRRCLKAARDFVLAEIPEYFQKTDNGYGFILKNLK